jgi:hypothetical protein
MYYQNPAIQQTIRKRAAQGLVIFTDHGEEQADDRDVTDEEIMKCLKSGTIEGEDWNAKYQDTTYRMAKKEGLHSKLIVVVALDDTYDLVVTAFRKEPT